MTICCGDAVTLHRSLGTSQEALHKPEGRRGSLQGIIVWTGGIECLISQFRVLCRSVGRNDMNK